MYMKPLPSQARLYELLHYNPETGDFFWKPRRGGTDYMRGLNTRLAGKKAGRVDARGYHQLFFDGETYAAHRIAWMYVYGQDPADLCVDHIDNIKPYNNRIANLRLATNGQNVVNAHRRGPKSTGIMNVHKLSDYWEVRFYKDAKAYVFGPFFSLEEAVRVRNEEKLKVFGEFARPITTTPPIMFDKWKLRPRKRPGERKATVRQPRESSRFKDLPHGFREIAENYFACPWRTF